MNSKFKQSQCLILLLLFLAACTHNPLSITDITAKKYSIYLLAKDGQEYLVETDNLNSGELAPEQDGVAVTAMPVSRSIIVKSGYYYHLDRKEDTFVKYKIENKSLVTVGTAPLTDFSIENFYWKSQDTLLLTGLNKSDFSQVKYAIINTATMKTIAAGNMDIPLPSGRFDNMSVGFVEPRNNRLLVGYTYHQQLSASNYTTSDTTYVSELNYLGMTAIKIAKDTRSTYPGGINTIQPYSFNDE